MRVKIATFLRYIATCISPTEEESKDETPNRDGAKKGMFLSQTSIDSLGSPVKELGLSVRLDTDGSWGTAWGEDRSGRGRVMCSHGQYL